MNENISAVKNGVRNLNLEEIPSLSFCCPRSAICNLFFLKKIGKNTILLTKYSTFYNRNRLLTLYLIRLSFSRWPAQRTSRACALAHRWAPSNLPALNHSFSLLFNAGHKIPETLWNSRLTYTTKQLQLRVILAIFRVFSTDLIWNIAVFQWNYIVIKSRNPSGWFLFTQQGGNLVDIFIARCVSKNKEKHAGQSKNKK